MATHIGIGFSHDVNTTYAAREAALQAKSQSKQNAFNVALVFSTAHYRPLEALRTIRQTLEEPPIIGCSTAGILLAESIEMRGIAVLTITSDDIQFGVGHVDSITPESLYTAGANLARKTLAGFGQSHRHAFIFFADGLLGDTSFLIKGIQEVLGKIFPVIGAFSSDHRQCAETHQYFNDKAMCRGSAALLVGGQAQVSVGNSHGWKPLGKPRFITKCDGHVIHAIDGKKASDIYSHYLGPLTNNFESFERMRIPFLYPLGIRIEGEKEYILRYPVGMEPGGSITCQASVLEGCEIHVMISNKDFCAHAAQEAAREARQGLGVKQPRLVIVFESLARHKALGKGLRQEMRLIRDVFGPVPLLGLYSYGEAAPLKTTAATGETQVLNGTIVVVAIA